MMIYGVDAPIASWSRRRNGMSSNDQYEYPDEGITDTLDGLNNLVWDCGYYCETDQGIWYELYVVDRIKEEIPSIEVAKTWSASQNFMA